jgi:hypothetical protein
MKRDARYRETVAMLDSQNQELVTLPALSVSKEQDHKQDAYVTIYAPSFQPY